MIDDPGVLTVELLDVARSANPPDYVENGVHENREFPARDGWRVVIFYDGGDLDYIDSFISPAGEVIDFWNWPEGPGRNLLMAWRGVDDTERLIALFNNERLDDMSDLNSKELSCTSGKIVAKIGDRFTAHGVEWEIVAFDVDVVCKFLSVRAPDGLSKWIKPNGTMELCNDSVAAYLLTGIDGNPRTARGDLLASASMASETITVSFYANGSYHPKNPSESNPFRAAAKKWWLKRDPTIWARTLPDLALVYNQEFEANADEEVCFSYVAEDSKNAQSSAFGRES